MLTGVYLSLKQMLHYTNGTIFPITEIGKTNTSTASSVVHENNALQCITDKPSCCRKNIGEWYYPSGERVDAIDPSTNDSTVTFYQNRGPNDGTVNLNYINMHKSNINLNSLTGEFCCVIPDAINFIRKICANIGKQPIL